MVKIIIRMMIYFQNFNNKLKTISSQVKEFRKSYLKYVSVIRNNYIAHLLPNVEEQIDMMERFQLSQTIEVLLKFGSILNRIGSLLNIEISFVIKNLSIIK